MLTGGREEVHIQLLGELKLKCLRTKKRKGQPFIGNFWGRGWPKIIFNSSHGVNREEQKFTFQNV